MKVYIYDGSFDGLLTAIYEAYYRKEDVVDIVFNKIDNNFLNENIHIQTDFEKAEKVYGAIEKKISKNSLKKVFYAYLSEVEHHGILALKYIQLGFKIGPSIDLDLSNDIVLKINKISYKVAMEKHRMSGLIRFKELENGILYSTIDPDHNIVGLVAPHFKDRLSNEKWVIHDVRRGIGAFYNKHQWVIKDIKVEDDFYLREKEEEYQDLWKIYFKSIAIENKINPKLQKRCMPMRYWKYLIEKSS